MRFCRVGGAVPEVVQRWCTGCCGAEAVQRWCSRQVRGAEVQIWRCRGAEMLRCKGADKY